MIPTFSVIVPCHNQGDFLAEALDSLLSQTYTKWECTIINDNSSDETEAIARRYLEVDSRFKYIFTCNEGVSVARNKGIDISVGSLILPLDADDKIAPFYLEKALDAFNHDSSLTLVYGEAEFFGDLTGKWNLPEYSYYQLLFTNMIYCSAIFKKTDFLRVGGFSEEMVYGHEDWDLWLRLLNGESKVKKLSDVVFYYRKKAVSRTTELLKEDRLHQTQRLLLRRNKDVFNKYIYRIINDLEESRSLNLELKRQLNLIKNSRVNKFIDKIKNISKPFYR